MNTNPDEVKLALWLDDELHGEELAAFEQWVQGQPEHLAAREETRRWKQTVSSAIPAVEEPPYPDFFNSRVARAIREIQPAAVVGKKASVPFWRTWLMPMAACAGMVAAFWMGNVTRPIGQTIAGSTNSANPVVYVPETGVDAEWFSSSGAGATVIVLQGVSAIPDSTDFFNSAYVPMPSDMDRTAQTPDETR